MARRTLGATVRIRVGLNSGEVVIRAIGSDLHMDYTAVGLTNHLATRMEQLADPGAIMITSATLAFAERYIEVPALGPVPSKASMLRWRSTRSAARRRYDRVFRHQHREA